MSDLEPQIPCRLNRLRNNSWGAFRWELFGGSFSVESPLLQQGELDFSPAKKATILKWALAPGFLDPQR